MPQRPRVNLGRHMLPGLAAVALFVVMAAVFLRAEFPDGLVETVGFDGSVTASIGYALFDLTGTMEGNVEGVIASDGFLAAFEIIDIVLVAALVGAVMLARREEGGSLRTAIADGGRQLLGDGDAAADTAADADASQDTRADADASQDTRADADASQDPRADVDIAGRTADAEGDRDVGETTEDSSGGGDA